MAQLEEAIEQLFNLGLKNPTEIVERLRTDRGDRWLRREAASYADDFVADMARRLLGEWRRRTERALQPGDPRMGAEMRIASMAIPGPHGYTEWKRIADLTVDDLEARAKAMEALAVGVWKRAVWCRDVIELMRAEGAATLGELRAPLPALPSVEELPALVAGS